MRFDALSRVSLEKNPGSKINTDILSQIRAIESKAEVARSQGLNPKVETAADVQELTGKIAFSYMKLAEAYNVEIDNVRQQWEKQRDKNPNQELAQIRRAETMINAMSDKELSQLAMNYSADYADLNQAEVNILAGKLNQDPSLKTEFDLLKDAMREFHANEPWLSDPDVKAMHEESERLQNLEPGAVVVELDGARQAAHIETLIDYDGELDKEV